MNKYKLVGILQLLFGILDVLVSLILFTTVLPQLGTLYSEMQLDSNTSHVQTSLFILTAVGLLNIIFGLLLLRKNQAVQKRIFIVSLLILIVTFVISGQLLGQAITQTISPIYKSLEQTE